MGGEIRRTHILIALTPDLIRDLRELSYMADSHEQVIREAIRQQAGRARWEARIEAEWAADLG